MTTAELDLDLRLRTFKASSSFTPGDALSFSIHFGDDISLPGRHDPVAYMEQLAIDVAGKNVLIVCPGNAGLAVAALRAGASTVVVLEPRNVYHRAIPQISEFASEVIGATFSQRTDSSKLVESFDLVLWSEGLDDISHPKALVEQVIAAMKKGSTIYWEINHGQNGVLPESTNAWRPSEDGFKATLSQLGDLKIVSTLEGRGQTRKIYTIQNNTVRVNVLPGPDFQSVEDIEEFAGKLKADIVPAETAATETVSAAAVAVSEADKKTETAFNNFKAAEAADEKVRELNAAVKAIADKTEALKSAGALPGNQGEGDLDSVYEGRASTPKSNSKKQKTQARTKKPKPKS